MATSVLTAIVQVTLALVPAGLIVILIGRRSATASATLAATTVLVAAGVFVAAFVPMPERWTWETPSALSTPSDVADPVASESRPVPGVDLMRLLATLKPVAGAAKTAASSLSATIAIVVGSCALISLTALLLGLASIAALRRRSTRIDDAGLVALVDELRSALGIARPINLRSSSTIGSAVTFGWFRPAIVLAADWRTWNDGDRRAVLAHELAHIRRNDFVVAALVRICAAFNSYHPLVHWLVRRLSRAQEFAADQLAASMAGGPAAYTRSLARMALRQDRAWLPRIAQSFGPKRNSLMGRLNMLKVMESGGRPLGRTGRAALVGVLIAIGLSASAMRGPAQTPTVNAPAAEYPPFELGYLGDNTNAFIAVRPGALLSRPDMKPVLDTVSAALNSAYSVIGLPANAIPLADVEQIIGPVEIKKLTEEQRRQQSGGERHALTMGLVLIRMNRDFDWAALLRSLPKTMAVTEKEPGLFELHSLLFGPNPMTLRVLDKRTIVTSSATAEEAAKRRAELAKWMSPTLLAEANRAGYAVVVNNAMARWTDALSDDPKLKTLSERSGKPDRLAVCLHWTEHVTASLVSEWREMPSDPNVVGQSLVSTLEDLLKAAKPDDATDRRFLDLAAEMLKSVKVRRSGAQVTADFASTMRWADIMSVALHRSSANVEVKEEKK